MTHLSRLAGAALLVLSAGIATMAAAPVRAAPLVTNGGFDDIGGVWLDNTGLGSDDLQSSGATGIPYWTNVPGFANEFWFPAANGYGLSASPGNGSQYAVDLTGEANAKPYGGIEQTIATTPGATYRLSFDLGASPQYNGPGLAAAALTASATGGVLDASQEFTLVPTSENEWRPESLSFTADSFATTIEFLADSAYTSRYTGLDNVSVTPAGGGGSGTAMPEPASLALLGAGLLGAVLTRRGGG